MFHGKSGGSSGQPADTPQVAFGRRVRELRGQRGLTQQELAGRAGIHWTYLSGIERGERNPALINIGRVADALDVSLAELFSVFARPHASHTGSRRR